MIGENAAANHLRHPQVMQNQPQIGAGQGAVGGFRHHDLVALRGQRGDDLAFPLVLRQQQIVPARQFLTERTVAAVFGLAGDAGEQNRVAVGAEAGLQALDRRDHAGLHALMKRRPGVVGGALGFSQQGRVGALQISVLHVDDQQRQLAPFQDRIRRFRRVLVVQGTIRGFPGRLGRHRHDEQPLMLELPQNAAMVAPITF